MQTIQGGQSLIRTEVHDGQQVIVKQYNANYSGYQEYQFLKNLQNSRNIVKLIKYQEYNNTSEIWMERCQDDLFNIITKNGVLRGNVLNYVMIELCNALFYVHCMNIVHLDIKLENILVSNENTIKICDFGFAKITGSILNCPVGTIESCSIFLENASVYNPIQAASYLDVNSLGYLFFELRFGKCPFQQASVLCLEYIDWRDNTLEAMNKLNIQFTTEDLPFIQLVHTMITTKITITQVFQQQYFKDILNSQYTQQMADFTQYMNHYNQQKNIKEEQKRIGLQQQSILNNFSIRQSLNQDRISFNLPNDALDYDFDNTYMQYVRYKTQLVTNNNQFIRPILPYDRKISLTL